MQISIINKSKIISDFRIDAELYQPVYLKIEKKLFNKQYTFLGNEVNKFKKGIFDINASCYCEEGVPFVRISNLKDMVINTSDIVHIPEKENLQNLDTFLEYEDIILSKTACPAASLVNIKNCNTCQDTIAIKLKHNASINSRFLVTFLNCYYGFLQMQRWFTGNVQMHLNLTDSRNIIIPVFSVEFQELIANKFIYSEQQTNQSNQIYSKAEQLLLDELGLVDWKPKHKLSFTKNYSDTGQSGRIDAEYFQPKYEQIINAVKKYKGGWDILGNAVKIKDKNFNPEEKKEYKYIELSNIGTNGRIDGCTVELGRNLPSRARRKVNTDDIVVSSIEGSLGSIAIVSKEYEDALCSTGFYVINSEKMNSESLFCYLKSCAGQMQLKKGCNGTILTAINKDEFQRIVIPKIDGKIQTQIQEKVQQSFEARRKSKELLEIAKKGVEMAIEKDEKMAMKWISEKVGMCEKWIATLRSQ